MRKICICGHFAFEKNKLNGQTVKTKVVAEALVEKLGKESLIYTDTGGGIIGNLLLPLRLAVAVARSRHIIILPAYKGVRVIAPILAFWKLFFKVDVHYVIIGGWLPCFMDDKPFLRFSLKKAITFFYPETSVMKRELNERGFQNVILMPNFKRLHILPPEAVDIERRSVEPLRLCTFSRVMKQKGIEDAIEAVRRINEDMGRDVYHLTIYGPVWEAEKEWFDRLTRCFPAFVCYGGTVPFDKSVEILQHYFALLFPTRFSTEGVPGTIIDSYAAGVPVISASWESFGDVIEDGVTGYGYPFGYVEGLVDLLRKIAENPRMVNSLVSNCLEKAKTFLPQNAVTALLDHLR